MPHIKRGGAKKSGDATCAILSSGIDSLAAEINPNTRCSKRRVSSTSLLAAVASSVVAVAAAACLVAVFPTDLVTTAFSLSTEAASSVVFMMATASYFPGLPVGERK